MFKYVNSLTWTIIQTVVEVNWPFSGERGVGSVVGQESHSLSVVSLVQFQLLQLVLDTQGAGIAL